VVVPSCVVVALGCAFQAEDFAGQGLLPGEGGNYLTASRSIGKKMELIALKPRHIISLERGRMSQAQQNALMLTGIAAVGFIVLASNPRCNRGCKTVAQHLAEHFLADFLDGLFGV
jgi:hypothetical protein